MRRRVLKVLIVCSIVLGLFVNVRADECDVLLNFLLEFATDADKAFDKMVDLRNADPELVPKIQHILSIATEDQRAKNIEQLIANRTLGDAQVLSRRPPTSRTIRCRSWPRRQRSGSSTARPERALPSCSARF